MEIIELFDGAVRFRPILLCLDIGLIVMYLFTYFQDCLLKGFKIDYWHSQIFLLVFIPVLVMYPFGSAEPNSAAVGAALPGIQDEFDRAWLLHVLGFIAMYVGYAYFNLTRSKSVIYKLIASFNRKLANEVAFNIRSKTVLKIHTITISLAALMFFFILLRTVGVGALAFGLRDLSLANETIRPLINFLSVYQPFILSFLGIRFVARRETWVGIFFLFMLALILSSGSRNAVIYPIVTIIVCASLAQRLRANLKRVFVAAGILLFAGFALQGIRSGGGLSISATSEAFSQNFFYGNSFADVRDFGWVLSRWDGQLANGNTYLAAFMSFVPRFISEFRQTNSISYLTVELVGFSHEVHAGLRPGIFGEVYFNFGLPGIVLLGLVSGYILRLIDSETKRIAKDGSLAKRDALILVYSHTILYGVVQTFHITSGFWGNYVLIFLLTLGWLLRKIGRPVFSTPLPLTNS